TPNGVITTVAGNGVRGYAGDGGPAVSAKLDRPSDLVADAAGNVYILDKGNGSVRKIGADGVITTVAGTGVVNCNSPDGGAAASTPLCHPQAIAVEPPGDLYIADGFRVRKVGADGLITTFAGDVDIPYTGPILRDPLFEAYGLVFDSAGNLYISDVQH